MICSNENARTAVMTDGYTWELFHIDQELGLYRSQFVADRRQSRLRILSTIHKFQYCADIVDILILLCAGLRPVKADESAVMSDNVLVLAKSGSKFEM